MHSEPTADAATTPGFLCDVSCFRFDVKYVVRYVYFLGTVRVIVTSESSVLRQIPGYVPNCELEQVENIWNA